MTHAPAVTSSPARRLADLPDDARRTLLASLSEEELEALQHSWQFWARPDQLPPPGDWRTWLLLGGRGSGKTRSSAEFVRAEVEDGKRLRLGLIGPTADSIRRDMVEGVSGILATAAPWLRPNYEPSTRRIVWPNGAIAYLLSSEEPDRVRGLNLDFAWADELTSWSSADLVWDMLQMALRLPGPQGDAPRAVVSTTPKPMPLLKSIIAAPSTVITRARTSDNSANLDASTLAYLQAKYGGSTLGRQELDAELLEDAEGALWTRALIASSRIGRNAAPINFVRIVVAVDPSGGSGQNHDECGIIVAALGYEGHGYILEDYSGRFTPEQWARRAVLAYCECEGDRIVAEANFGGAMVEATMRAVDPNVPVRLVHASRGKAIRAEPIVALYEQGRVHHVGEFPVLEDQLCQWEPRGREGSPDRLDAMVWALTELMISNQEGARYVFG